MIVPARLRAAWLGAALLAGCAGPTEPPPLPADTRAPASPVDLGPAARPEAVPERDLCDVMAGLLAGEAAGFPGLRGQPVAAERWVAEKTLPGLGNCAIEGSAWPRARFTCASERVGLEQAHDRFEALAAEIHRCLARPSWFPRDWERGRLFEFAMGERQQTWMDRTTVPPTAVVLKIQQDLVHWDYRVFLNLQAIR